MSKAIKRYDSLTDRQLLDIIFAGNEEAAIYLIYNRYLQDIRYLCFDILGSHDYADEACQEMYILFKGKEANWSTLKSWRGLSSFRTWINRIMRNHILKKHDQLIDSRSNRLYSDDEGSEDSAQQASSDATPDIMYDKVLLVEAIGRIPNAEQKMVVLKHLQGYSHKEIAAMLNAQREKTGCKQNIADNHAVDVLMQRAKAFLRKEFGQMKK